MASDFRPGKPLTSKSGTLAYLAPEVYEGGGYYFEVDWWSLGVTFYECIYNKVRARPTLAVFCAHILNSDHLRAALKRLSARTLRERNQSTMSLTPLCLSPVSAPYRHC